MFSEQMNGLFVFLFFLPLSCPSSPGLALNWHRNAEYVENESEPHAGKVVFFFHVSDPSDPQPVKLTGFQCWPFEAHTADYRNIPVIVGYYCIQDLGAYLSLKVIQATGDKGWAGRWTAGRRVPSAADPLVNGCKSVTLHFPKATFCRVNVHQGVLQ